MKLFLLFFILPFVQNVNRRARNDTYIKEMLNMIREMDNFPKLSDVLPNLVKKTTLDDYIPANAIVKNISIDIDKININKFRKRMNAITNTLKFVNETKMNISRRQENVDYSKGQYTFRKILDQMQRRKCADVMLQLLYMARHKITRLEKSRYFSTTDTAFRIAYAFRKIKRIYIQMMRYYTYQRKILPESMITNPHIMLHGKVTRLHVDFNYFWRVLTRVDMVYKNATNVGNLKLELEKQMRESKKLSDERKQTEQKAKSGDLKELEKENMENQAKAAPPPMPAGAPEQQAAPPPMPAGAPEQQAAPPPMPADAPEQH